MLPQIRKLIGEIDFDPEEIQKKYRQERDRRIRRDGSEQYIDTDAEFSHYTSDPNGDPNFSRDPYCDEVKHTIIGAGFGGLMMGARLRDDGFDAPRYIDTAADFGGTWYWNRYPGAACDIESYCYLPLLEETGYMPKSKYALAPEIFEHCQRIARHYGLYEDVLFQTSVTEIIWLESEQRWQISTDKGDRFLSQFLFIANGSMDKPKLPGIPGIHDFKGHTFHTSRWDYGYTGGDSYGNLTKLTNKNVAIIGTGCTAVQCVPFLAESAKQLYVFQRTPSTVDARGDSPTDPEWVKSLKPGWQRQRMQNFDIILSGGDQEEDLVNDGWTEMFRSLTRIAAANASQQLGRPLNREERLELLLLSDHKKMNEVRKRIEQVVVDPETADGLKPWYRMFCKRPTFNDGYLDSFNRPNVKLVNTNGKGVDRITERGIVVGDTEYPVDCIIFASGFEVNSSYTHRAGYDVIGRGGKRLSEYWANGLRTLHGLTADGFPNLFFLGRTQTATPLNYTIAIENQTRHVSYILSELHSRGFDLVEPTPEAVDAYVAEAKSVPRYSRKFMEECTPGYFNNEGNLDRTLNSDTYGAGSVKFFESLEKWRSTGELPGLSLSKSSS